MTPSISRSVAILMLILFSFSAFAQTTTEYNAQAKQANSKGDYDGVINAATLSLNVSLNGEAYWWRAIGYYNKKNYTLAVSDATKAMSYYTNNQSSTGNLYVLRADSKFYSKDYDGAILDYLSALEYDISNKKSVYLNLIKAYESYGDYKNIIECYRAILKFETNSTEQSRLLYRRALAKSYLSEYTDNDIINDLNSAITKNNQNFDAIFYRGTFQYDLKKYDSAKSDLEVAAAIIAKRPKNEDNLLLLTNCYIYLADILTLEKKYVEVKNIYQKLLQYEPNSGYAYWGLGLLSSAESKSYSETLSYYQKADTYIKSISLSSVIKFYLNYYSFERKHLQFKQALEVLNKAIMYNPSNFLLYWDKGYIHELKKEYDEGVKSYDKAFSLMTTKDSAQRASMYTDRGLLKLKTNNIQAALLDIQTSIALKPSYENYMALGKIFKIGMKQTDLANGNFQKAMAYTITGMQKKDTNSNYAYAAAAMGDRKTAERFIKKMIIEASAKAGELANEYHNAACIYTTLGDIGKALEYLELSLKAGYSDFEHMLHDADLEPLYSLQAYKNLLLKYKVPTPVY